MGLNYFWCVFFVWLVCQKVTPQKKVQTYVSCPASPGSLSMGLNCFLCFFWFWLICQKVPKKVQAYVSCPALSWVPLHGSELFCFLIVFFWGGVWLVCQKVAPKNKSSDLCLLSSLSWVPLHGSELFAFFGGSSFGWSAKKCTKSGLFISS